MRVLTYWRIEIIGVQLHVLRVDPNLLWVKIHDFTDLDLLPAGVIPQG